MNSNGINGKMITLARESRGITQKELAEKIGVEQGQISKIENEILGTASDYVDKISEVLGYPVEFFYQKESIFNLEYFYYRKGSVSQKELATWEAIVNITRIHIERLISNVNIPEKNFSFWEVDEHGSPEACAITLRQRWGVAKGPIDNLTKLLEDNGIVVVYIHTDSKIDGISMYTRKSSPLICINDSLPPDRKRLTLAHELGHLLMHFNAKNSKPSKEMRDLESEAFSFASEFLMPSRELRPQIDKYSKLDLKRLLDLKSYWKISMNALLYRSKALDLITDSQYRYLWAQMGKHNYRINEPLLFAAEKSTLLPEIINFYMKELHYSHQELSKILLMREVDFVNKYLDNRIRFLVSRAS